MKNQWTTIFGVFAAASLVIAKSVDTGVLHDIAQYASAAFVAMIGATAKDASNKQN